MYIIYLFFYINFFLRKILPFCWIHFISLPSSLLTFHFPLSVSFSPPSVPHLSDSLSPFSLSLSPFASFLFFKTKSPRGMRQILFCSNSLSRIPSSLWAVSWFGNRKVTGSIPTWGILICEWQAARWAWPCVGLLYLGKTAFLMRNFNEKCCSKSVSKGPTKFNQNRSTRPRSIKKN